MRAFLESIAASVLAHARRKKGQTLVEYTLILAIITLVAVGVFALLGQRITIIFSAITLILDTAQSSH